MVIDESGFSEVVEMLREDSEGEDRKNLGLVFPLQYLNLAESIAAINPPRNPCMGEIEEANEILKDFRNPTDEFAVMRL